VLTVNKYIAARSLLKVSMKTNYLNNRDMLREIHLSKLSYCSFNRPEDRDYDLIIHDFNDLEEKIQTAKHNQVTRLLNRHNEQLQKDQKKSKLEEFHLDHTQIPISNLVFRLMTWQHVPDSDYWLERQQNEDEDPDFDIDLVKTSRKHVRVNFPPFEHYRLNDDLTPYCVGRSHWRGDLETGEFCKDHGSMTRELATMFMKLCERYASRGNWRGYTYNEEMKGQALLHLVHIGLQFDESKSSNPFSYYTQSLTNSFTRVLNIEKRHQNIRDDILELNNYNPSYTRQGGWQYGDE